MASIIALGEGAFQLSRILGYWTSFRLYGVLIRNYNYISNAIGGGGGTVYMRAYIFVFRWSAQSWGWVMGNWSRSWQCKDWWGWFFCISVVGTELGDPWWGIQVHLDSIRTGGADVFVFRWSAQSWGWMMGNFCHPWRSADHRNTKTSLLLVFSHPWRSADHRNTKTSLLLVLSLASESSCNF